MPSAIQRIGLFIFKHPIVVKRMKTNDDKSVKTPTHNLWRMKPIMRKSLPWDRSRVAPG